MRVPYTSSFYNNFIDISSRSASIIVPHLLDLFNPKSVVDFGCGMGTWLKAFVDHGIDDIVGIDGHHVNINSLLVPSEKFIPFNLDSVGKTPYKAAKKFDLAISLEVAEHISKSNAELFISRLTACSSVIMFSAAVPYQGGTNHINEQWPSYWAEIFSKNEYVAIDYFRPKIWLDRNIPFYYKQNLILFINKSIYLNNENFKKLEIVEQFGKLDMIHPDKWGLKNENDKYSVKYLLKNLPGAINRAINRRIKHQ